MEQNSISSLLSSLGIPCRLLTGPASVPFQGVNNYCYKFLRGYVGGDLRPAQALVVVNGRDTYNGLLAILSTHLLWDLPIWSQLRKEATPYFQHIHNRPLLDSFPNILVLLDPPATTNETRPDSSIPAHKARTS